MEYLRKLQKTRERLRDLTKEEAEDFMLKALEGKVSDVKITFFLTALRIKGDTSDEILGIVSALKKKMEEVESFGELDIATNYDGRSKTITLLPTAVAIALNLTKGITFHDEKGVPVKKGTILSEVFTYIFESLNDKFVAGAIFEGVRFKRQREFIPSLYELLPLRQEIGFRTSLNVAEKLLNPFGSKNVIVSVSHKPYVKKTVEVCRKLGFERITVVMGVEGSVEPHPARPTYVFSCEPDGEENEFFLNPRDFFCNLPLDITSSDPLSDSVRINTEILNNNLRNSRAFLNWACITAGLLIYSAGKMRNVKEAVQTAKEILTKCFGQP